MTDYRLIDGGRATLRVPIEPFRKLLCDLIERHGREWVDQRMARARRIPTDSASRCTHRVLHEQDAVHIDLVDAFLIEALPDGQRVLGELYPERWGDPVDRPREFRQRALREGEQRIRVTVHAEGDRVVIAAAGGPRSELSLRREDAMWLADALVYVAEEEGGHDVFSQLGVAA